MGKDGRRMEMGEGGVEKGLEKGEGVFKGGRGMGMIFGYSHIICLLSVQ